MPPAVEESRTALHFLRIRPSRPPRDCKEDHERPDEADRICIKCGREAIPRDGETRECGADDPRRMKDGAVERKGAGDFFLWHKLRDERRIRRPLERVRDAHDESDADEMPQQQRARLQFPSDKYGEKRLHQNHREQNPAAIETIRHRARPRAEERDDHQRGEAHPRLFLRCGGVFLDDELLPLHLHPRADHRDKFRDHEPHENRARRCG